MKLNHYLSFLFISAAVFANAQYKRSYNHFYRTPRIYQTCLIEQANASNELVRAEVNAAGDLVITSSTIDQNGDLTAVEQFSFDAPAITFTSVLVAGVVDNGNERILLLELPNTSTMRLYALQFNTSTGTETESFLHPDEFRCSFINSIVNGDELVNYVAKSSGGLYRLGFDTQDITAVSEEVVDAAVASIGSALNLNTGKDAGKITLFNGKEVTSFISGAKQLYERTAANAYAIHTLNANTSGSVNFVHLPNGNLFVSNNGDLFELNSTFQIVNSSLQESSTGSAQSEFGLVNGKLQQFFTKTSQPQVYNLTYDLNLNMIDSVLYSEQKLIDLIPTGNGVALLGYMGTENQVNALYDGDNYMLASNPVCIDYFTSNPNLQPAQEFHHAQIVNNLHVEFGLGNQFFPQANNITPSVSYNDSIGVVFNMTNVYTGFSDTDTLGVNGSIYAPVFLPGPYTTSGMYSDLIADEYNRGFFVSVPMIQDHLDSLEFGSANYVAPHGIKNWPAHGNTALGQAEDLAPFVDVNSNGLYEPYLGDYPSIYGDYCFFSITHDNPNAVKSASIETHSYKYWFDCDTSAAYQNTVFNKTLYFSRTHDFDQFNLGTFSDIDLGNYSDDYGGTHAELGLVYQYNGDLYDENMSGRPGFYQKTPATGVMILKGSKLDDDTQDNPDGISGSVNGYGFGDGITDNEFQGLESSFFFIGGAGNPAQSDPNDVYHLANYLNGMWKFGDELYYGGDGFAGNTTSITTKFMFPGESDTLSYGTGGVIPPYTNWSEMDPTGTGSISNPAGDRRSIAATGVQQLHVGDTVVYDIVYVITSDTNTVTSLTQAPNSLFEKCKIIKNDFNQNNGSCGISFDPIDEDLAVNEKAMNDVLVYPNPTNNTFKIEGLLNPNSAIAIYDINGRLLFEQQNVNAQTEISLQEFSGNVFLVSIQDGNAKYIKRVIKN